MRGPVNTHTLLDGDALEKHGQNTRIFPVVDDGSMLPSSSVWGGSRGHWKLPSCNKKYMLLIALQDIFMAALRSHFLIDKGLSCSLLQRSSNRTTSDKYSFHLMARNQSYHQSNKALHNNCCVSWKGRILCSLLMKMIIKRPCKLCEDSQEVGSCTR